LGIKGVRHSALLLSRVYGRLIWDMVRLELQEVTCREDPEFTLALWSETVGKHRLMSQAQVVTNADGKVVFVVRF
jgi:hypothetical protein